MMRGAIYRSTLRNRILNLIYRYWPRVDQWAIKLMDAYPCDTCTHYDEYGCINNYSVHECFYKPRAVIEADEHV